MFSKKSLRVDIQKISGTLSPFSGTYSFKDLPIEVNITKTAMPSGYTAYVKIYGVTKQKMDSMTAIAWKTGYIDEISARIYANDGNGEHLLFTGYVVMAVPDYSSVPDTCISITLCAGAFKNLVTDVPPSSDKSDEEVPVRQVFKKICDQYNMKLNDIGVRGTTKFPRPEGDGLSARLSWAAKAYKMNTFIDGDVVTVYPKESYDYIPKNSPVWTSGSDYIGYPSFNECGIEIRLDKVPFSLQPSDFFVIKGSDIAAANDRWSVVKITFNLSTKIGGKWITSVTGVRVAM